MCRTILDNNVLKNHHTMCRTILDNNVLKKPSHNVSHNTRQQGSQNKPSHSTPINRSRQNQLAQQQ
jgi:hypothetical protein